MATKKQKRERGEARQAVFAEESKRSGLSAQQKDLLRRQKKAQEQADVENAKKAKKAIVSMMVEKAVDESAA